MAAILADIPNPIDAVGGAIGDVIGGAAEGAARSAFEFFMSRFADMLADAAKKVTDELLHFLSSSTSVNLDTGWFAGPRAKEILAVVGGAAGVLMVLFLLFAIIQGLMANDVGRMLRAAAVEVPVSVFGMLMLITGTGLLLGITDALSGAVLATAPESLARFYEGFTKGPQIMALGFVGFLGILLFIVAAILVWIELLVRASLIYLLLAMAPLALAARVWPQLRGAWHRIAHLGIALILSKFVVALALGLGAAALGGGGPQPGDLGNQAGLTLQALVVGVTLMCLAAFAPFLVLKIIPIFEAALVAQGISRGPLRSAQTGLQMGYYGHGLARLAGGNGSGGGGAPGVEGAGAAQGGGASGAGPGGGAAAGLGGGGGAAGGAGGGAAAAGGGGGAAAAGGSAAAGGGAAAAGGTAAAGAAAGPAAAVVVPVGAAKAVASQTKDVATKATEQGSQS
ncbi:MAG: hypothetical protein ABR511_06320 [Acidimicrobiales bacterium]